MEPKSCYRFGPFSLDVAERVLLREGRLVPLPAKTLSTLLVLVRNSGHVVEKHVLMNEVWPDEDVEEGNLAQHIFMLRKALGQSPQSRGYIETVPRRGYRLIADVEERANDDENGTRATPAIVPFSKVGKDPSVEYVPDRPAENVIPGHSHPPQLNPAAYRSYLKGRYYWNKFTQVGLEKAVECFRAAVDLDPALAMAYVGLADSYLRLCSFYVSPSEIISTARAALLKALEIDEGLAEAHATLAKLKMDHDWDWDGAEQQFRRALELNPNYSTAHLWYGTYLESVGKLDEALVEKKIALTLEPLSLHTNVSLASTLWLMRRHGEALERIHETLEMDRDFLLAQVLLSFVNELSGDFSESLSNIKKAHETDDSTFILAYLGRAYALAGMKDEAKAVATELQAQSARRYVSPYSVALLMDGLGAVDRAIEWLEKAYQQHDVWLFWIKIDPRLDHLRSDARFKDIVRRIFLPRSTHSATQTQTEIPEAYQLYLRGRHAWSRHTREGLENSVVNFEQAVKLDPGYALAYAAIVDSYLRLAINYLPPPDVLLQAGTDQNGARTEDAGAMVNLRCGWDLKAIETEMKRARELKSNFPTIRQWQAACWFALNLYSEATGKTAEELKPVLTPAEEVQVLCIIAREQSNVGNYAGACAVMKGWWTFGQWPKLEGLSVASSADLLFTVGTLAGFVASMKRLPRGQKHAQALHNGAIGIFEQLGCKTRAAEGRIELGLSYFREGLFDLARQTLLTGLEALGPDELELRSSALIGLSFVDWQAGRLHDAVARLDEGAEVVKSAGLKTIARYHLELATLLQLLARAEARNEYFDRALFHYQQAIDHFMALGHQRFAGLAENNIGLVLVALDRLAEAEVHLVRTRKWFSALGDERRCAEADESLAELHIAAGRFDLAEQLVARAVETLEPTGHEALFAEALRTQGLVLSKLGRQREAKRVLERAYQVAERCGDSEGAGSALLIMIEEMCERLDDDERLEVGTRLSQALAHSQTSSTLERLRKCQELIAANPTTIE